MNLWSFMMLKRSSKGIFHYFLSLVTLGSCLKTDFGSFASYTYAVSILNQLNVYCL